MNDKEQYAESFGRWKEINEIIIEDLSESELVSVAEKMANAGYNVEYWKCPKQINGHLHIKNIVFPEQYPVSNDEILLYEELVMKKYIPEKLWEKVDWNFIKAKRHRIAEENKEHYKGYGIKTLIKAWNPENVNWCEKDLFFKAKNKKYIRKQKKYTQIYGVSIIKLAENFGFEIRGNKAVCLFHKDTVASLNFDDDRGLWYCFGCCEGGNIAKFLDMCHKNKLKRIEVKNEKRI